MPEQVREGLEAALEELALAVVILDEDDLPGLGNLLNKLEALAQTAQGVGESGIKDLAEVLKSGLEKIVLGELEAPARFIALIPQAVSTMQELCRRRVLKGESGPLPEGFYADLCAAAGMGSGTRAAEPALPAQGLPSDLDKELALNFISESLDLLQEIETHILAVEQDPEDPETINAIFRPFHTIKGVSGFLNLGDINHLSHDVENLLDEARSGRLILEGPVVDLILDAVDLLRVMISDLSILINTGQPTGEDYGLSPFIQRIGSVKESALAGQPGRVAPGPAVAAPESVRPAAEPFEESETAAAGYVPAPEPQPAETAAEEAARSRPSARAIQAAEAQAVKVDTHKLDAMVDMVGELVIALSLVTQNPKVVNIREQKLERDLGQLKRITTELQKTSMSLRMVPIRQTFQRMTRLVRDLAKKSGKEIELVMEGAETEIDRNMVDAIYDPLVHMVRNSCDHGLEDPAARRAAGKNPVGSVNLRAFHQGGRIVIEVEDDGRGLDQDKILAKALEKGLVDKEAKLSESDILHLVMKAGFSTAEKVTDISGRGVGMDVVKAAVEKLRGSIEITSKKGVLTKFLIRLPLTMAIIEGMIVGVDGERFIIPTLSVEEVLKPKREAFSTVAGGAGEMVLVRGRLLPLVRLARLFGRAAPQGRPGQDDYEDRGIIVVVEAEGQRKALLVDELLGKQEVVIKSLGAGLKDLKGLAGGAILGDGRVGLILDVSGLFQIAEQSGRPVSPSLAEDQS